MLLIISISILSLQFQFKTNLLPDKIEAYYLDLLQELNNSLTDFQKDIRASSSQKNLKKDFASSRLLFKKLAVLTDYFNPLETRYLNSPALNRIESEVADKIIPPAGFQAVEELLFKKWDDSTGRKLLSLTDDMLQVLDRLKKEPDLSFKFKDIMVWDALRSATAGIITTGITGMDSPVANFSIPEAGASLDGITALLTFFKESIKEKSTGNYERLTQLTGNAKKYLSQHPDFNSFDRLRFITGYMNPLYHQLVETRKQTGIGVPAGRHAINFNALSIFDKDALSIDFYSPAPEYWVTPERIQLGKRLFSDPILSGTHTRSCASCHHPEKAFTDGLQKPYSLDNQTLLGRNTPTLYNSGYQTKQFYDSRADILENQLTEVVHNTEEMKGSLLKSVEDLKSSVTYVAAFKAAYPAEKRPINTFTIANAIASYVRSLQSLNSRFDQYMRGDQLQLSAKEKKGFNLFAGKAKCATCHFIPLFNGAVPPFYAETESEVLGVPKTKDKNPAFLDEDLGKYLFTHSVIHKYSFKIPTLRNIRLTAPYMHNGVYQTLEEVMEFYNNGGGRGLKIAPANQSLPFDKLNLSKKEIRSIIAFLETLTDTSAVQ